MPRLRRHYKRRHHRAARALQRFARRRVVKRTSTRKLALINRRMFKKADDRLECKYLYQGWNNIRVPPARAPVANGTMSTYQTWSTQLLTGIQPLRPQGQVAGAVSMSQIVSANQREGKDVYISGIHVKLQFEFPASTPTALLPPWCDCHCVIVRERQNSSHDPPPSNSQVAPPSTASIKVPTTFSVFDTTHDTAANPQQGNLMWKNMQSGQNYIVAAHKKVRLAGFPVGESASGTPPTPILVRPLPYINSAKFMDFHYHPKCKVEFNSPTLDLTNNPPAIYEMVAQKNNVYCIFWSVTPVPPTGFTYTSPLCSGNTVTRFTDS